MGAEWAVQARDVAAYVWRHPANRGRRARSLMGAVRFQVRGRTGRRTLTSIGERGRMWAQLHHTASSKVAYSNPPDWNEMQAWRRILSPGDLFVDVGSNVGSYALWAGEIGARVVAVEPDAEAAALLRENVAMNAFDIEVMECALAAEPGRMALTTGLDTVNHLVTGGGGNGQTVMVSTVDSVLAGRSARGMKVDVEGAEKLVLAGAAKALADGRIAVIQLEWNDMSQVVFGESRDPVVATLESHGYRFFRPDTQGCLQPADVAGFGPDVFAVSSTYPL